MSDSLNRLIAERLDISEERAHTLLRTMLKELRSRARDQGVRLPELGTFREEDGTLSFSPSASLRRHVNQEYEGLSAEDLSSAPPSQAEDSTPPFSDHPDERFRPEPADVPDTPAEEAESDSAPEPSTSTHERKEPQKEKTYPGDLKDAPLTHDQTHSASRNTKKATSTRSTRTRSLDSFQLIVGILLLVFLLGAGWFVFSETGIFATGPGVLLDWGPSNGTEAMDAPSAPNTTMTQTAPSDTSAAVSPPPTRLPGASEGQSGIDPTAGGWTIVVASANTRASAEAVMKTYVDRFSNTYLPIDIIPASVEGATRYRVGIGQYEERDSVVKALDKYDVKLPDGAWVLRLR